MYQSQRVGDRVRVVEELCERQRARVVELLTGHSLEDGLDVLDLPRELLVLLKDGLLRRFENAIESSDDREWEHHLAVFRLLVVTAQQIGDGPDEGRVISDRLAIAHDCAPAALCSCCGRELTAR